jgi:hypothetical protein
MKKHRTRKSKARPNYQFLVSWEPNEARVKRESKLSNVSIHPLPENRKNAESLAQEAETERIKKNIFKSLILISLILILELVIYLARREFLP